MTGAAAAYGGAIEEVLGQRRNISRALPQGRDAEGHDVQAVIEIRAKGPALHFGGEIAIGGGHQADIELPRACASHALELALLQDAQEFGLQLRSELADFIEKDGTAFGHLELALFLSDGSGEGALLVSEQLTFEECLGEGGAVDGDEGFGGARAEAVQSARHQFLAGAGFAEDEHRGILWSDAGNQPEHLVNRDALTGNAGFGDAQAFAQEGVFGAQAVHVVLGFERGRGERGNRAQGIAMLPEIGDLTGGKPGGQQSGRCAACPQGDGDQARRRIDGGSFAGNGCGQRFHVRGRGAILRRRAQLLFVLSHEDRAGGTRYDIGEQGTQLSFEGGAVRLVFGGYKGAEQKEDGAGAQQRVARGGVALRRRFVAIEQNDIADRHLIAGRQVLFGYAHSVDVGAGRAAPVGEAVPGRRRANHAVFGGNPRFGQTDACRSSSPNRYFAIGEWEARAQERSADDSEFSIHFRL